jgi:hypothetical protein
VAARRAALSLTVALLGIGCAGDEDPPPGQAPNTVVLEGQVANDRGSVTIGPEQEPQVTAGDFYFEPTVVIGPPGGPEDLAAVDGIQVYLVVTSASRDSHNVSIPDQEIDVDVPPGGDVRIIVTFPDSGTLVYACKYHRGRGMAGALVAT